MTVAGVDLVTGCFGRNGNGSDSDGPPAATHLTLTYKTPQYEDRQPYNGRVAEGGLRVYNLLPGHT